MVSVIVPIYNVKPYLAEAVESILHQSYGDLEIILVDDGSTDGSGELCDVYAERDQRIKVIHQCNKGLSGARNAGLDICTGEYIAFLDPDDAFCKDFTKIMLEALQMHNADIVECDFAVFRGKHPLDEGKIRERRKQFAGQRNRAGVYTAREALNMHCDGKMANSVWNKMYTRHIWRDLRYREGQNFEDLDIILHILERAERVCIIDKPLVMYRIRKEGITRTNSFKNTKDRAAARQHYFEYIVAHTPLYFDEQVQTRCLENWVGSLLYEYYHCLGVKMPEKDKCIRFLKDRIDTISPKINYKNCKLKVKAAYFLYCHVPLGLSMMIYRVYMSFRKVIKMVYR